MKKFHNLINKDIYFWHILQYKIYALGIVLYRITRHPIYTGLTGMLFGSMLLGGFGVWVLYFIVALIAVVIKIGSKD